MADLSHPVVTENKYLSLSLNRPITIMLVLFVIAVLIKILDTFVWPVNELVGELIITKALGFLLVVAWVWLCGRRLDSIGFHGRALLPTLLVAIVPVVILLTVIHAIQFFILRAGDEEVGMVFSALDLRTGLSGGLWFGVWLVAANVVNSAMEEGLFRGLMLKHFLVRYSFWSAMLLQMALFAIWHLNWPVYHLAAGDSTVGEAAFETVVVLLSTSIAALFYGFLYAKTNSIWASFVAHFINNSIFNVLFFSTAEGNQIGLEFFPFQLMFLGGHLLLIPIVVWLARRQRLPQVRSWAEFEDEAAGSVA